MGQIIDDILNMTDEEKRAIYNDKEKYCKYLEISDIFQESGCVFSYELDEIEEIGENKDYEEPKQVDLICIKFR